RAPQATDSSKSVLGGRGRPDESLVLILEVLAETYAGFWRKAVFPEEGDWVKAGCSIEREGGGLPDTGLKNESPNAERPRLRLENSHETAAQTPPAHDRRHIHPLELCRIRVEEPQRAAADRHSFPVHDKEGAAALGHLRGIQLKVVRSRLGIQPAQLRVQRLNETTADVGGQLGARYGDSFCHGYSGVRPAQGCRSAARAETRRLASPDPLRGPRPLQLVRPHHVGGAHDHMHTRVLLAEGTQYLIVPPDESHRLHRPRVESLHELR